MSDIASIIRNLEQQRKAIEKALSALREIGGTHAEGARPTSKTDGRPRKRAMSEEGRRRIAEATRKRWAEKRAADAKAASKRVVKKAR